MDRNKDTFIFDIMLQETYGTPLPAESLVSLLIWFVCVLYASFRTSSSFNKIAGGGVETLTTSDNGSQQQIIDPSSGPLSYRPSPFPRCSIKANTVVGSIQLLKHDKWRLFCFIGKKKFG